MSLLIAREYIRDYTMSRVREVNHGVGFSTLVWLHQPQALVAKDPEVAPSALDKAGTSASIVSEKSEAFTSGSGSRLEVNSTEQRNESADNEHLLVVLPPLIRAVEQEVHMERMRREGHIGVVAL